MKRLLVNLSLIILFILVAITFVYVSNNMTGEIIRETKNNYSYTKAICNETNYCQDYEIICDDEDLVYIRPITGATIQHAPNWEDPRDEEIINKLCG